MACGGAADNNPFRYCGEYFDYESGLLYLRARYYDAGVGSFTQEDPAKDGLNWYVYCGGNPVNFWDPTGLVAGQIGQNGYGSIYNSSLFVNDKYGKGWTGSKWGNLQENMPTFLMKDLEYGAGNCTLTAITRVFRYQRIKQGLSGKITGDFYTTYQDVRNIAVKYGFDPNSGTNPTRIDDIINDLAKKYGLNGGGSNTYLWDFSTFTKEIDAGRPVLLNISFGYYADHTVTVVGYSEFKRGNEIRRFLKVYDGWTTSDRYIDYSQFISQTFASITKINISE